jgi:hypothetical protein
VKFYLGFLVLKRVDSIKFWLKSDKNDRQFTYTCATGSSSGDSVRSSVTYELRQKKQLTV